jgi:hypothetical protein
MVTCPKVQLSEASVVRRFCCTSSPQVSSKGMEGERGNCELNGRGKAACCTSSAQFSGKGMEGERGNCELNGRGKAEGNGC